MLVSGSVLGSKRGNEGVNGTEAGEEGGEGGKMEGRPGERGKWGEGRQGWERIAKEAQCDAGRKMLFLEQLEGKGRYQPMHVKTIGTGESPVMGMMMTRKPLISVLLMMMMMMLRRKSPISRPPTRSPPCQLGFKT